MSVGAPYLFRTPESVDNLGPGMLAFLRRTVADRGPQFVKHGDYRDPRSLDQNALQHVWYSEIESQGREMSAGEARRYCKLTIGVPIMRGGDTPLCDKFRHGWDALIKPRLTYEEKLELMDWFAVTSLMNKDQMRRYLETMQRTFAGKGVSLTGIGKGQDQYPEALL